MTDDTSTEALERLEAEALQAIAEAEDEETLEEVRVTFLGRSEGRISGVLRGLGQLPPEDRPVVGQEANRIKGVVSTALEARAATLHRTEEGPAVDLTLPARTRWKGALHPVTQTVNEIWHIFRDLGFTRARGPEADTEWYNFEALNTPLDHPAADEQDTLYLVDSVLLRSHTSPVQMRTMERHEPPIRI
ncbi:MAG: phenylalanine--tRNA ligase subunit alpha, partial [Candidatus Thermoplasmatota archaeon]|nr:phenylalanine--tRNA ligase subunit alpha [Candidatus Thermoplasmatota archaeon]